MSSLLSHLVQKRFSEKGEDVATDALAFILDSSKAARNALREALQVLDPEMPCLAFRTQESKDDKRPDMRGFDEVHKLARVFIENKFWAGLTSNQPVEYLRQLADRNEHTVLLFVVPAARDETVWRELTRRLEEANIKASDSHVGNPILRAVTAELRNGRQTLALASWAGLLDFLQEKMADDPGGTADIRQLRALCDAMDLEAIVPVSPEQVSDQRTPRFLLQLGSIVRAAVRASEAGGVLSSKRLMPQASWDRMGQYVRFPRGAKVGGWFGLRLDLWKSHGTPLWLVFRATPWSRSGDVRPVLEPWAKGRGVFTSFEGGEFRVAVPLPVGEEKERMVQAMVDFFQQVSEILSRVDPGSAGTVPDDATPEEVAPDDESPSHP